MKESLTPTEKLVVAMLYRTNAQIAERLNITVRSVEMHCVNIYSKLGVSTRTEAALVWYGVMEPQS